MKSSVYRFEFTSAEQALEAELTLHLAIHASEGLLGEAKVRMDVSYHADTAHSAIYVDGGTLAGEIVSRIFTALVTREFGPDEFTVRRVCTPTDHSAAVAA